MASSLLILYLISLFGYSLTRGFYAYPPFLILLFSFFMFLLLFFSKGKALFRRVDFEQVVLVVF